MQQALLLRHTLVKGRCRIRSENMKRSRFNSLLDRPLDRPVKNRLVVIVHAKNEAPVYLHPQIVKPPDSGTIVWIEILILVLLLQIRRVERLKSNKQAP